MLRTPNKKDATRASCTFPLWSTQPKSWRPNVNRQTNIAIASAFITELPMQDAQTRLMVKRNLITKDELALGVCGRHRAAIRPRSESNRPMKTRVFVTLKTGVLDPQGKAIHHALEGLGFKGINDVRAGKLIELDLADSVTEADLDSMCRQLLANTVIENYRIERG